MITVRGNGVGLFFWYNWKGWKSKNIDEASNKGKKGKVKDKVGK